VDALRLRWGRMQPITCTCNANFKGFF